MDKIEITYRIECSIKDTFTMAALKKVNALLKSFDLFSALSINKKYVFIQLYMQIH